MANKTRWKLNDERWEKIAPLLPESKIGKKGGGPRADNRKVFEGVLWILRTGAPWSELPGEYGSASTCWRRLKEWEEQGVWLRAWRALLSELDKNEQLDWSEAFVDGSFAPAKKGLLRRANQKGQRHEVDGGGRRPRNSFGEPLGLCESERSQAP